MPPLSHGSRGGFPRSRQLGLTPRRLTTDEARELLDFGIGVTNIVTRPTRAQAELDVDHELPDLAR
jgi:hypothetical protein